MADYNIPDLVELTAGNVASTDLLEIYDSDAGENKKVLVSSLVGTTGVLTNSRVVYRSGGAYATNDNFQFDGNYVGIGGASASGFRVRIYGEDAGNVNSALRILDSTSTALWSFRNDGAVSRSGFISIGTHAATLNTNIVSIRPTGTGTVGSNGIVIGTNTTTGTDGVAIGKNASSAATAAIAIGSESTASAQQSIKIGNFGTAAGQDSVAIGRTASTTATNSIAIGTEISAGTRQISLGFGGAGSNNAMNSLQFNRGNTGYTSITPDNSFTLIGNAATTGTNIASTGFFNIQAPAGTGTGAGASIDFQVAPAGASGSTANTAVTRVRVRGLGDGISVFQATAPVVPSVSVTDGFIMYSNDASGGNAAPHFRTENGAIVKIYQETNAIVGATYAAVGGTNIQTNDTFDGYTLAQIVAAMRAKGELA